MATQTRPKFEQEFKDLPLEEKIASLFRMEAATLEESFHYIVDSTKKAAEKAGETLSDLSSRMESEFKKATCAPGTSAGEAKTSGYTPPKAAKPKNGPKKPPKAKT
jgi:hypothetical protein